MPFDKDLLTTVVTLILAAGGGIRWWLRRRDARKPIPTATAEAALMSQLMGVSGETLDDMRGDIQELRARANAQQLKIDEQGHQLDQMRRMFTASTLHIEALMRWARDGAKPPPPSLPLSLREVIDPSLQETNETPGRL